MCYRSLFGLKGVLFSILTLSSAATEAGVILAGFGVGTGTGTGASSLPAAPGNEVIFGNGFEFSSATGSVYRFVLNPTASGPDVLVNAPSSAPQTILFTTTYIPSAGWAYMESDGRYYSATSPTGGLADIYIAVDGKKVSNDSTIDWTGATYVSQHCFNAIAAVYLTQGYHDIQLNAYGSHFDIGAYSSNLSLVANAASNIVTSTISSPGGPYNFTGLVPAGGIPGNVPPPPYLPKFTVMSQSVPTTATQPIISFASFSETNEGRPGDALLGIYENGLQPTLSQQTWTDNDGFPAIEQSAPMYSQAYFPPSAGTNTIALNASLYPWSSGSTVDNVYYEVDAGARLLSLVGGMTVYGSADSEWASPQNESLFGEFWCIGTSEGYGTCPTVGTPVQIATAMINVPPTHSGEIFLTTKIRMQGDPSDKGGYLILQIYIDGSPVPSYGVQVIANGDGVSERTMSTSYFTAGQNRLSTGLHTIAAYVTAFVPSGGSFIHITSSADLPLIWFD